MKLECAKGRRALNASSGLGIRKNGLNMMSCNLIFWSVVMPILTFGSEIWVLSDKDRENLQNFQRYAGRRVQRFPQRSPNMTSFFGLGWIKISTYIMIKKALFIMTILRLETPNIIKEVFLLRLDKYFSDLRRSQQNFYNSPIFDILNSCQRLGILEMVVKMAKSILPLISNKSWSKIVWDKAWVLDDAYWESLSKTTNDSNILYKTIGAPRYLSWWQISDNLPIHTRMCESLARIVCKSSLLKSDDYSLKSLTPCNRVCNNCDMYAKEDIKHLLMQCLATEDDRVKLHHKLCAIGAAVKVLMENEPQLVYIWLLGGNIEGLEADLMLRFWITAGYIIRNMYNRVTKGRSGVG